MIENKNLILAIVLSVVILVGFQLIGGRLRPTTPPPAQQGASQSAAPSTAGSGAAAPSADVTQPAAPSAPAAGTAPAVRTRAEVVAGGQRVRINTPELHGSISLTGGRIDDLTLVNFRETIDPNSPEIVLFSPPGSTDPYFAEMGWVGAPAGVTVPGPDTQWTADADVLTPAKPLTLTWDNGSGLIFKRIYRIDENFMFTLTQEVENRGAEAISINPYSVIARWGTPVVSKYFILHEGPIAVIDGTLKDLSYKDLAEQGVIKYSTTGGWLGFTDKFWLGALIPVQDQRVEARFVHTLAGDVDKYQADYVGSPEVVPPGGTVSQESRLFAGAKQVRLLDRYADEYGIKRFDLAIDFGWFYFLTKPIFLFLIYIKELVGNLGIAILLLTVCIKLAMFPLANKSYRAMSQMRKLGPEMTKLRERFADDKARLNQEMMALYKREKVNPASGCLPMVVQIPVFFALYKVLFVTIEMRHAPFFGWIQDLSAPDPTTVFNLFGLIPWDPSTVLPAALHIGAWPLIMGVTMFLQQRLNPQPPDPIQAKIFMFLPVVFTFMLARFPAGLVVYWTWNNILSVIQQWVIMRRMGVKA
ncbi:MAG: membrane protein insertase YidC [Rhodospirillales bacterium]|nr:membrane protein insertase YidC [Rhodospirillales bacterium]